MVHHPKVHLDLRAQTAEAVENFRHPVHGNAGIGRHTDNLRLFFCNGPNLIFQIGIRLQKFPDGRHQLRPLLRQLNAVMAAPQQREPDLPLQSVHHVSQAGLGVPNHLRSLGKAAKVGGCHQNLQFFAVHMQHLILWI